MRAIMFTLLDDTNYQAAFNDTTSGICIFFKKLCPYCLNMEKVLQKVSQRVPDLTLLSIDSEESPKAREACGAELERWHVKTHKKPLGTRHVRVPKMRLHETSAVKATIIAVTICHH